MNLKNALDFLKDLSLNNNREWFAANKKRFLEAQHDFESVLDGIIRHVAVMDPGVNKPSPKDCMFRIYRDTRFSHDKTPYKLNFGGFIAPGGKNSRKAGYYVHLEPGSSMLAGGIYMPQPEILKAVRNEVYFHSPELKKILKHPDFLKYFREIDPFDKLKKPPKDFPADFEDIDLLKYRSYSVVHLISDEVAVSDELLKVAGTVFRTMLPFNNFLNRAVGNMSGG